MAEHDHIPVQHRDGKPPWCPVCGLTKFFTEPVSLLAKQPETSDAEILWSPCYIENGVVVFEDKKG